MERSLLSGLVQSAATVALPAPPQLPEVSALRASGQPRSAARARSSRAPSSSPSAFEARGHLAELGELGAVADVRPQREPGEQARAPGGRQAVDEGGDERRPLGPGGRRRIRHVRQLPRPAAGVDTGARDAPRGSRSGLSSPDPSPCPSFLVATVQERRGEERRGVHREAGRRGGERIWGFYGLPASPWPSSRSACALQGEEEIERKGARQTQRRKKAKRQEGKNAKARRAEGFTSLFSRSLRASASALRPCAELSRSCLLDGDEGPAAAVDLAGGPLPGCIGRSGTPEPDPAGVPRPRSSSKT